MRADGTLIGSKERDEGSIFLEPQPWSVISGAVGQEVCGYDKQNWRCTSQGWQPLGGACGSHSCAGTVMTQPVASAIASANVVVTNAAELATALKTYKAGATILLKDSV